MYFPIENFSTYFCMVLSSPVTIPQEFDLSRCQIDVKPEILSEVISTLHEMFQVEYKGVIEKLVAIQTDDYQPFMETVISRCIKISEKKTTYAHFMLVCTLINGIISNWFENKECFLIPRLCSCCLVSIYEKCYKNYFCSKEEGNTLDFHIRALKKLLDTQKSLDNKRNLPIFSENNVSSVIQSLIDFDTVNYTLNDRERKILTDILSSKPIESSSSSSSSSEFSIFRDMNTGELVEYVTIPAIMQYVTESAILPQHFSESARFPSKSESSSYRDIQTEDAMEYFPMPQGSSESTSWPSEPESRFHRGIQTEDAMEYALVSQGSLESARLPSESESSSYRDIQTEDAMENVFMPQDSSKSTITSSEPESSYRDIKTENVMGYGAIHGDSSELERRLYPSYRDTKVDNPKKLMPLKKYYSYYKNRICASCAGRCATPMVSYVEDILEKCQQ